MRTLSSVRRGALIGGFAVTTLLLAGCGEQQLLQTVTGLLGALTSAQGAGPLQGPLIGALPQAPLGQGAPAGAQTTGGAAPAGTGAAPAAPTTSGNGLGTPQGGQANGLGDQIATAAYNLPDPFPYAPGTENGNLGCADVVSHALEDAGAIDKSEHNLSVDGLADTLRGKGWKDVGQPYQNGDVIVWSPTASGHKHIGIIVIENGDVYAINNSSSQKKPIKILLSSYNRGIDTVLRNPGGVSS